jgi:hypothetical protein
MGDRLGRFRRRRRCLRRGSEGIALPCGLGASQFVAFGCPRTSDLLIISKIMNVPFLFRVFVPYCE